jgi:hypothetical protein
MAVHTQTLVLRFRSADGKTFNLNVPNPREDLTEVEVRAAMEDIIDADIFSASGSSLAAVIEAYITDLTRTEVVPTA